MKISFFFSIKTRFSRICIDVNNFQKIDFYRKKIGEVRFLTNMRVRNTILASKMGRQADFAPHKGPQGPDWALKGTYPKKFLYLILHNFFENSSGKYFDNQNFIEISLKLNFWDCFEILQILKFFLVFSENSNFWDILPKS